jgi:hypothetical protein
VEAFLTSLKFKFDSRDSTKSRNDIFCYFERKDGEQHSKGWLGNQFFESLEELNAANVQLPMLVQALCSGNPNSSFNKLLGHTWGLLPPARLLFAIESQFCCFLFQQERPPKFDDPEQSYQNYNDYDVVCLRFC